MFYTEVKIPKLPGAICHGMKMWTIGSCFADETGSRLENDLFDIRVNPCGTLYNPASIAHVLTRIIDRKTYTASDIFMHNGMWHCMDFHSAFSCDDADRMLERINSTISSLHDELPELRMLMITFGSAHTFVHNATGHVAGNCHKLPASHFTERDMSVDEITALFTPLVERLRKSAPAVKVMFTVSPIRHKAYGYHADRLSKATLLLAADMLCRSHDALYFPAYEIMNDELRDYRFYAADMIHPSQVACDHIYTRFNETYFNPETSQLAAEARKFTRRLRHRPMGGSPGQHAGFLAGTLAAANELKSRCSALHEPVDRLLSKSRILQWNIQ